jgi:hypothetical protein
MGRSYNIIHQKLVEDEGDVVGHIAYSLYKLRKADYIRDFKEKHNGQDLTEDDLIPFHNISCLNKSITAYKLEADAVLDIFLEKYLHKRTKEIEQEAINIQAAILDEIITPIKPPSKWKQFFWGTMQGLAGAIISTLIAIALFFLVPHDKIKLLFELFQ